MKYIRTIDERAIVTAGEAVSRVVDETITLEIRDDFADVIKATRTKPAFVGPPLGAPLREVILGHGDILPGSINGVKDHYSLVFIAAMEIELWLGTAGGSETTGELQGATGIEVDGVIRWLDRVISSSGLSQVVCDRGWGSFHEMPGEPKPDPLTIAGGVGDGGYSKYTDGVCAENKEGSMGGREEHDDEGSGRRGGSEV